MRAAGAVRDEARRTERNRIANALVDLAIAARFPDPDPVSMCFAVDLVLDGRAPVEDAMGEVVERGEWRLTAAGSDVERTVRDPTWNDLSAFAYELAREEDALDVVRVLRGARRAFAPGVLRVETLVVPLG